MLILTQGWTWRTGAGTPPSTPCSKPSPRNTRTTSITAPAPPLALWDPGGGKSFTFDMKRLTKMKSEWIKFDKVRGHCQISITISHIYLECIIIIRKIMKKNLFSVVTVGPRLWNFNNNNKFIKIWKIQNWEYLTQYNWTGQKLHIFPIIF